MTTLEVAALRGTLRTCLLVLLIGTSVARAEVTRFDVTARTPIAGYAYERIAGRATFSVDPLDSRNAVIVDIDKAPRTPANRVEFSADVVVLMPTRGGNGVTLLDVVNRGSMVSPRLNRPVAGTAAEVGDGFLLKRGFTIVAVGWEWDAPRGNGRLTLDAPIATDDGTPITGMVRATFVPDRPDTTYAVTDLGGAANGAEADLAYPAVDNGAPDAVLTVRDQFAEGGAAIPRDQWRLEGNRITLAEGFTPGRIYEIAYRAKNPRVGGAGFLAVRDVAAWVKHESSAPINTPHVYALGVSQTGRFLRDFLYHGGNTDERGRQVFDAMMIHIAGASRTDVNRRWGTPVSVGSFAATSFPFADVAQLDAQSGARDGALDNPRARANQPKIFYTNTGVEYWGGARAAALLHTTVDGSDDVAPPPNVRVYFFAGAQHGPGPFPPPAAVGVQQRQNPTDYWWSMRALLVALDRWTRDGVAPPKNAVPALADSTLVKAAEVALPTIPGLRSPRDLWGGKRAANPLVARDGGPGAPLPFLVPQVDADGNERAGVRLPEVAVPLATYTGWNFRDSESGGAHLLRPLIGSYVPFAATREQRAQRGDPRPSIAERYSSSDAYLRRIKQATAELVRGGYLLQEDVPAIEARAVEHWTLATAAPTSAGVTTSTAAR
jgi:hypothetical protein